MDNLEVAIARVETQIEALRADLSRYFSEMNNQEARLRQVEDRVSRLSERLAIASVGLAGLQIVIAAVAAWVGTR